MVKLLPCPFCGEKARFVAHETGRETSFDVACGTSDCFLQFGGDWRIGDKGELADKWNRRAPDNPVEYWAGVIAQAVINGLAGASEFARIMSRPGVTFTAEQDAKIHALVEAGDAVGAQRIILDALEKALDTEARS